MWSFISTSVWRCRTRFSDVRNGRGMNEWHAWKGWWALYRTIRTHLRADIGRIYICIGWRTITWTWGSNGWYSPEMNNSRGASKRAWPCGGSPRRRPGHSTTARMGREPAQPLHGYYTTRRYYSSLHAKIFLRLRHRKRLRIRRRLKGD